MTTSPIVGWFDRADQVKPTYDPGRAALCPICLIVLGDAAVTTTSLMPKGGNRSYFFRAHTKCWFNASDEEREQIEHSIIDGEQ